MFIVRDRETGTKIESVDELENARFIIKMYEEADRNENIYESNFYEIYDSVAEKIVE
jgi:hypothetical protein